MPDTDTDLDLSEILSDLEGPPKPVSNPVVEEDDELPAGRPPSVVHNAAEVQKLCGQGISKSEIARRLAIGRTSVRRLLAQKKS